MLSDALNSTTGSGGRMDINKKHLSPTRMRRINANPFSITVCARVRVAAPLARVLGGAQSLCGWHFLARQQVMYIRALLAAGFRKGVAAKPAIVCPWQVAAVRVWGSCVRPCYCNL